MAKNEQREGQQRSTEQDAGQEQVQATFDEAGKKGYFGTVPEGQPSNEEYSLRSGPDGPDEHEVARNRG